MIVKTNDQNFVRDEGSNVLINTNVESYRQYKYILSVDKQFKKLEKKIEILEKQLQSINERLKLEQNG